VRAAAAKRYLKSDFEFIGVDVPAVRAAAKGIETGEALSRLALRSIVQQLWERPVFELKLAAVELLSRHQDLLRPADLGLIERLIRSSHTWALVDPLAIDIAGQLLERYPELGNRIDRWSRDTDFWVRRSALLTQLRQLRRRGDFRRFARYADQMLDEREFFIRKAIGWVLRETGKSQPEVVTTWLEPRMARASGLTIREAVKYLPADSRRRLKT
jgi:3-methyladenine DNA glycosylase AlkD